MQPFERSEIKDNLRKKTTLELTDILSYSQDDYKSEAISIIKEILIERGLSDIELEQLNTKYQSIIANVKNTGTQKRIPRIPKFLIWILSVLALAMAGYLSRIVRLGLLNNAISNSYVTWDMTYEKKIRSEIINSGMLDKISEKYKDPFCNCYIGKLKILYPHRIKTSLTKSKNDSIVNFCVDSTLNAFK